MKHKNIGEVEKALLKAIIEVGIEGITSIPFDEGVYEEIESNIEEGIYSDKLSEYLLGGFNWPSSLEDRPNWTFIYNKLVTYDY